MFTNTYTIAQEVWAYEGRKKGEDRGPELGMGGRGRREEREKYIF